MTSYTNAGGTGNRTSTVTASSSLTPANGTFPNLVDGDFSQNSTHSVNFQNGVSVVGAFVRFDFGVGAQKCIDEAKWYQSTTDSHGTWKWQGSQNASAWTDIGSSFTLGGATTQTQTALNGNTTKYRYYQLLGVSGVTSSLPWLEEAEFKINADLTLALASGSFALTGFAATLQKSLHLACAVGSFALTGIAVALVRSFHLALATGSFALTGIALAMTKLSVARTRLRTAQPTLQQLRTTDPTLGE